MLIGIGLGPGDPDLITFAAVKALKKSHKIYVPGKLAAELVKQYAEPNILEFPMIKDKQKLLKIWEKNAELVTKEAKKGIVSFAVIGDPNIFSTFTHLKKVIREKYPEIEISTIPGISSITAQASKTNTSIDSSFIVTDGSPINTKIVLKAKNPKKIQEKLEKQGYDKFVFAEKLFTKEENIKTELPQKGDYFSLIIAKKHKASEKVVYFVGAGPGDPKYITVKGKELLNSADLVVYAGSLVSQEVLEYSKGEKINSYGMKLEEIIDILVKNVKLGKTVVRLHSGDPSLYGAIIEQISLIKKHGIDVKIIPGVTALFSAAASLKIQLTLKGITETLIITRPSGNTLEKDSIYELSKHNATMGIYLGTDKIRNITQNLAYPPETPAAVVYHASWDDEKIILGKVCDIADKVEKLGIKKSAMIIIGDVISPKKYIRSHLYE